MELLDLWLPILLSAVGVWFASAIFWMVLPHHQKDSTALPDEDRFIVALKEMGIGPGNYGFPFCADKAARKDAEIMRKWKEGPKGFMTVLGDMNMGKNMALCAFVYVIIGVFIAYLASLAVPPLASFSEVFQFTATAGVLAHLFGWICGGIWFSMSKNSMIANAFDSVVYGLMTGLIFALLWPGAPAVG